MPEEIVPAGTIREQMEAFRAEWQELLGDTGGKLARDLNLLVDTILTEQEEMISGEVDISDDFLLEVADLVIQQSKAEVTVLFSRLASLEPEKPELGVPIMRQLLVLAREQHHMERFVRSVRRQLEANQEQPE